MTDPDTLRAWTRANKRARLAHYAVPIAGDVAHTTCLADCGRRPVTGSGYCAACRPTWEKK